MLKVEFYDFESFGCWPDGLVAQVPKHIYSKSPGVGPLPLGFSIDDECLS